VVLKDRLGVFSLVLFIGIYTAGCGGVNEEVEEFFPLSLASHSELSITNVSNKLQAPSPPVRIITKRYCQNQGVDLMGDLYLPDPVNRPDAPSNLKPAIVFTHGGGLVTGSKRGEQECTGFSKDMEFIDALADAGFVVFSIDYRLASLPNPQKPCPNMDPVSVGALWPAQIEDTQCAVRYLRANANQYGVDPDRIGSFGASSGGKLALIAAHAEEGDFNRVGDLTSRAANVLSEVKAAVSWYAPTEMFSWRQYVSLAPSQLVTLEMPFGGSPSSSQEIYNRYVSASAVNYVDASDPPLLAVHGSCDYVVPYSQSSVHLSQAYANAGKNLNLINILGAGHGFRLGCNPFTWNHPFPRTGYNYAIARTTAFFLNQL
jgi:acetyl esterase/lipase